MSNANIIVFKQGLKWQRLLNNCSCYVTGPTGQNQPETRVSDVQITSQRPWLQLAGKGIFQTLLKTTTDKGGCLVFVFFDGDPPYCAYRAAQ